MNPNSTLNSFIDKLQTALQQNSFIKIKFSKTIQKNDNLKKVIIRLVEIKNKLNLSFVYNYQTKDITKNFSLKTGVEEIKELIENKFKNCVLFTTTENLTLNYNSKMKAKLISSKPTLSTTPLETTHNRKKARLVNITNQQYLKELGLVNQEGQVKHHKQAKYKQINKYIETLDSVIRNSSLTKNKEIKVVDMGSGKGYLTFAFYDYLLNTLKSTPQVTGVEMRKDLIDLCNSIAQKCNFDNLKFTENNIQDYPLKEADILIALHACDTATDDAIYKGINANCSIIVLSPCCHKQIRKELNITDELKEITKHGILEERMAEMVTDSLRSLILEAYGYQTKIFEYIADHHTHKNLMITAVKKNNSSNTNPLFLEKIKSMKKRFGVERFYLEELFKN